MNKTELVTAVAGKTGLTKKDVLAVLDTSIEVIEKSVTKGDDVVLVGFGTFKRANRKARKGFNPQTGKAIKIAAKKVPVFKAGTTFKNAVSKSKK